MICKLRLKSEQELKSLRKFKAGVELKEKKAELRKRMSWSTKIVLFRTSSKTLLRPKWSKLRQHETDTWQPTQ